MEGFGSPQWVRKVLLAPQLIFFFMQFVVGDLREDEVDLKIQSFSLAAVAGCDGKRMSSVSPFPSPKWLLSVYVADVFSRLEELKSAITSTLGKILKVDSTKGVTKKLASSGSRTAAW
ncbi:chemosensory receptor c [Plakobranchus ocellatus]|uniref:Chemosensory receptor c n=1 Tax=Plakobranchus ocellatus TaxID=259542 RepID=A0AAV4DQR1_9GAST|nr:chemosensory receptor c [Plakobranchus ocellatus]